LRYTIESVCLAHGYSRHGYYKGKHKDEKEKIEIERVLNMVQEVRRRQPRVGCRKLQRHIASEDVIVGRDRLFTILRVHGLLVKKKKNFMRTTQSNHWMKKHKNLIKDSLPWKSEQVYVSDITYIDTCEGFKYLSLITDMYSRKIVGWELSGSLTSGLVMKSLFRAVAKKRPPVGLIHHSDRGSQYCSMKFWKLIKQFKMKASMSRRGNCYDNAPIESFWGTLKNELVYHRDYHTRKEAIKDITEYIEIFYNRRRIQKRLEYLSPVAYEKKYYEKMLAA